MNRLWAAVTRGWSWMGPHLNNGLQSREGGSYDDYYTGRRRRSQTGHDRAGGAVTGTHGGHSGAAGR